MRGRPTSSYVIAGILALVAILGLLAVLVPILDCPRCVKPRGWLDIHICRQGRVSVFQWWMLNREPEQPRPAHPFSP